MTITMNTSEHIVSSHPTPVTARELLASLIGTGAPPDRPAVVAIDGRSGSGKSTLAAVLRSAMPQVSVVHTDDVAWHHSFFGWHRLLIDGLLEPIRRHGPPGAFRPPAWEQRSRPGAILVPDDTTVILVEGVGAARRELWPWLDSAIWMHTDTELTRRRLLARDGTGAEQTALAEEWLAQEAEFLSADRPWTRASAIVSGHFDRQPADPVLTVFQRGAQPMSGYEKG